MTLLMKTPDAAPMVVLVSYSALLLLWLVSCNLGNTVNAFVMVPPPHHHPASIHALRFTNNNNNNNKALQAITPSDNNQEDEEEGATKTPMRRDRPPSAPRSIGGAALDRRGTLMTLLGSAISFAASDALLGAATSGVSSVLGVSGSAASSIYGIQWNGLYRRVAALGAKHEAAVASPELVAWVARTPAAFVNAELRAWVAAQRAFSKSRQIMGAAAALEEAGLAGAVAAAAVATKKNKKEFGITNGGDDSDNTDGVSSGTSSLEATSISETESFSSIKSSTTTTTSPPLAKEGVEEAKTATATNLPHSSSSMKTDDCKEKEA